MSDTINKMPDKIWDFHAVIVEVLESRGLKMLQYSRVVWRQRESRGHLISNQKYQLLLRDESSGQESRVDLLIDDESTQESVKSQLEQGLEHP